MNESILKIADETVSLASVRLRTNYYETDGIAYFDIDLSAVKKNKTDDHFLAINSLGVTDCKDISDLQGRTFVITPDTEEETEGCIAAGELMESMMGDLVFDPFMFQSLTLKFGNLSNGCIPIEMAASVFNLTDIGIPVEGRLIAEIN